MDDPFYENLKYLISEFSDEFFVRFALWEISPIIRFLDRNAINKCKEYFFKQVDFIKQNVKDHCQEYSESVIKDLIDALISAKNDALNEGKESAKYLTDTNLSMIIIDLLVGMDSSQHTFQWMLLLMTYFPNVLQKLRQEIESEIGDRIPTHEDRNRCHYVMAFISETLRIRNPVPGGFWHKLLEKRKIGIIYYSN